MDSMPPMLWLQAFEAAARTLSFTQAGQELAVSQSAVSQRIRLLEDRLGQKLFVRHARSLTLTPAGRAWLPSVQEGFARLAEGTAEVFGPRVEAPVTLRATPVMQQTWLAPLLLDFHRRHPQVVVRLVSAIWRDDFGPEGADIEIRYGLGHWEGSVAFSLGDEELLPACSAGTAERLATPQALAGETLIHAVGFAVGWSAWLERAGVPGLDRQCGSLICDSQVMSLSLAARGGGVALAHRSLLAKRADLVAPFALSVPSDEGFWLVRPARRSPRPEALLLWDWLVAHGGETNGELP
ncbi:MULTISPECIES: LysR substrate-binding domain-containing protein [Halomonadaceae]|nr:MULTISPECIES: LysR substrate-binding domain-containing protein [Halomonas]MCD6007570.1 LysR family transcriptional regulator [Halomonas sp. IOP_31]MEA3251322.1 LysR substrate-binding domain-containing protein [Pseudomonadota bacterium]